MKITKCGNGHFYDAEGYAECPFCKMADAEKGNGIPSRFAALGTVQKTGQGSTGFVYKISGEKTYALKEIVCRKDAGKYQNALYEIAVMQKLAGTEQVVHLYDCEEKTEGNNKTLYLLEEYLTPFSEYLSRQPLTVGGIIEMTINLCDGLIACRQAGVAQLDIQPKNLFVDQNGTLKIGDFGCSLFLPDLDNNRLMRGTLTYMAPEVYRKSLCSEQSDIYSTGILLYCLFNDRRLPFMESGNEELAIYKRLAGAPFPKMAYRDEALLPKLTQVIGRACAYEAGDRFRTFEELKDQLSLLLEEAQSSGVGSRNMYQAEPATIAAAPVVPAPESMDFLDTCSSGNMDAFDTCAPGGGNAAATSSSGNMDTFDTCAPAEPVPVPAPAAPASPKNRQSPTFCRFCGSRLSPGQVFCAACGAKTTIESSKVPPRTGSPDAVPLPSMAMMPSFSMPSSMAGAPSPSMPPSRVPDAGSGVDLKKVQFSAVAPKTFIKGDYTMIEIVMYEEAFRKVVDELIAEAEAPVKETKSGIFRVAEGTSVRIVLSSPDIEIEDGEEEQEWQGGYLNFSFAVMLPEEYKKRQILFTASVYLNDVIATKLKFIVKCFSLFEQKVKVTREDVLSAFISYASQDRHRVAAIIQGMKKARPEMDIFFDVDSLRSGEDWEKALYREIETRDILFLFWSQNSRESKWVDAEWRYALKNKGIECIEPVPIDPPGTCPPPAELSQKHFNDKLLYIINENGT